ncbi:MAG: RdgB/HAM1 family non-canonical purine NTP pyrophosphatase [Firmicutes bacterium]|nr:RdgB/HAM1 family non-canonical purine NTP pyrophosphatase [Bacillota bacterium]
MIEILIASQNQHKIKELKNILSHTEIKLITLMDLNDHEDVVEDGESFFENALIKAKYFANKHNKITISDDSGLVVDALDGRPGIYSARYSGKGDYENNLKVLCEMENVENRKAHFVCEIVLCYPNGVYKSYRGEVHGFIANEIKGEYGFGYDSIFYMPEYQMTFGQLDALIKNRISHRANALKLLKENIDEIIDNK